MSAPLRQNVLSLPAGEAPATTIHPRAFGAVQQQGRANSVSNWFVDWLAQAGLRARQNHQGRGIGVVDDVAVGFYVEASSQTEASNEAMCEAERRFPGKRVEI